MDSVKIYLLLENQGNDYYKFIPLNDIVNVNGLTSPIKRHIHQAWYAVLYIQDF